MEKRRNFLQLASFTLALLIAAPSAITHAAIFDSADFLKQDDHSAGAFGDIVLNNPSGEGLEARYKWAPEDYLNLQGILGMGSDTRKFTVGGQVNYNFLPDIGNQPGVSVIGRATLLKRRLSGNKKTGIRFTTGPMVHKEFTGLNGLPLILYTAVPWSLTLQSGSYVASSQIVLGALTDITKNHSWFVASEAGLTLSKGESFIMIGAGMRFTPYEQGPRQPARPDRPKNQRSSQPKQPSGPAESEQNNDEEFRTEDFQ